MIPSDYWAALGRRQRLGLLAGAALVLAGMAGLGAWLLRDPLVPLAAELSAERLALLTQELDRARLGYRISDSADAIAVPQSQLGKARAALAGGSSGAPPSVGLELFKDSDFSSNEFAQKINYQRALQGELTRTIQAMGGVRSARVHVILPEGGLFRRSTAKASAAVSIALQPGRPWTRSQVRGLQRLVAAAVPEIKVDDVVVLDESGTSLTRPGNEPEGELSSNQLDMKRQADQYLEGKLTRLLEGLAPRGTATLSVDVDLDDKQLRVTTEEPVATRGPKGSEHPAGVLVKERQSQRGRPAGAMQATGDGGDTDNNDWEFEYKVGHRIEQTLSAPGAIKRVSVAVALQGAPAGLSGAALEQLVAHAVGMDPARGDSVAVLLLPGPGDSTVTAPKPAAPPAGAGAGPQPGVDTPAPPTPWLPASMALLLAAVGAVVLGWPRWRAQTQARLAARQSAHIDATVEKVRLWLTEDSGHGRS